MGGCVFAAGNRLDSYQGVRDVFAADGAWPIPKERRSESGGHMKLFILASVWAFAAGPALAATAAIDNERVTAWDVKLTKGEAAPPTPAGLDSVTMFLGGGTVTTRRADGSTTTAERKFGDAVFNPRGSNSIDTATSDGVHEVVIALKDAPSPPPNVGPQGIPLAFPRAGSEKILEGAHFIVWRFSWVKGVPVPMHHHDKDTVMVFRYNGTIHSTPPQGDGEARDLPFKQDEIRWSKAGTTHTETLIDERQSAVDLELK
jgi:hypothetical protein